MGTPSASRGTGAVEVIAMSVCVPDPLARRTFTFINVTAGAMPGKKRVRRGDGAGAVGAVIAAKALAEMSGVDGAFITSLRNSRVGAII